MIPQSSTPGFVSFLGMQTIVLMLTYTFLIRLLEVQGMLTKQAIILIEFLK